MSILKMYSQLTMICTVHMIVYAVFIFYILNIKFYIFNMVCTVSKVLCSIICVFIAMLSTFQLVDTVSDHTRLSWALAAHHAHKPLLATPSFHPCCGMGNYRNNKFFKSLVYQGWKAIKQLFFINSPSLGKKLIKGFKKFL